MGESTARRTLVKSPPELWAEISDAASLAKHLGEFGEIRITKLEPESTVVWEADRATGRVEIQPSGWGTKVTLTAEPAQPAPMEKPTTTAAQLDGTWRPFVAAEPVEKKALGDETDLTGQLRSPTPAEPEAIEEPPTPEPSATPAALPEASEPKPMPVAAVTPEPEPIASEPKKGLFARLFSKKAEPTAIVPAPAEPAAEVQAPLEPAAELPAPDPEPMREPLAPVPDLEPESDPEPDLPEPTRLPVPDPDPMPPAAAEVGTETQAQAEDEDAIDVDAVLTGALDSLGSAHHRPFSRG